MTKPKPAAEAVTDIRDVQVIKHGSAFFLWDRFGDVPGGNTAALGLYFRDTRFLSRLELTVDGLQPLLLHSSTQRNYSQIVELAYPMLVRDEHGFEHRENLSIHRTRLLAGSLLERIEVWNYGRERRTISVQLDVEAAFLDLFEVRGVARTKRGQRQPTR